MGEVPVVCLLTWVVTVSQFEGVEVVQELWQWDTECLEEANFSEYLIRHLKHF